MPVALSPEQKREWEQKIRQQNESRKSVLQWCRENNVNYDSMLYRRKQLGLASTRTVERSSFKELPSTTESTGITIEYQRVQVRLSKSLDPNTLMQYLQVLKGEP